MQLVSAYVFWPWGQSARNPGELLPRGVHDRIARYFVFRNRWKDDRDVVVSALLGSGPQGYKRLAGGPIMVWGLGIRTQFPVKFTGGAASAFEMDAFGGRFAVPVRGGLCSFAVDFSGRPGCRWCL